MLNNDKTEFIIIGTRQQLKKVTFNTLRVGNTYGDLTQSSQELGQPWFDELMNSNLNTHVT